jgi:Homocysteine S-methyltransferase
MSERVLLLAGSAGPERIPARPDPEVADWYLPLHVRDERVARERIAGLVAAGADVVVAPTWLTHRRALLPLGETRRAGAWSAAAVHVARQAVGIGLERREDALAEASRDDLRGARPVPLVAATLPALDEEAGIATGRLLPREAAAERDYRDQAGTLADAEPDLILVEGQRWEAEARMAVEAALDTGLPVWAALTSGALATTDISGWAEWARAAGLRCLLLPGPLAERLPVSEAGLAWGAIAPAADPLLDWLEAGATAIGWLDGANSAVIEPLRGAIDEYERAGLEAAKAVERRWLQHVTAAAAMADGGAAVWIGEQPGVALPEGFEWLVAAPHEARRLPDDHYRLAAIATDVALDPARLLVRGGIVAVQDTNLVARTPQLQLLAVDDSARPVLAIARRER